MRRVFQSVLSFVTDMRSLQYIAAAFIALASIGCVTLRRHQAEIDTAFLQGQSDCMSKEMDQARATIADLRSRLYKLQVNYRALCESDGTHELLDGYCLEIPGKRKNRGTP